MTPYHILVIGGGFTGAATARIMPHCIEVNGSLFIALDDSDMDYKKKFLKVASSVFQPGNFRRAGRRQPNLSPKVIAAVRTPTALRVAGWR
jgi:hypothetical protein